MKGKIFFRNALLLLLVCGFGQSWGHSQEQKKEDEKKEEQKEPEAVDIEDAAKESNKAAPDVGYTKEEYDEFQKALNNPDLKLRADGLSQFIKTHPTSKLNEHAMNSAKSACLNTAEGAGRVTRRDKARAFAIARGEAAWRPSRSQRSPAMPIPLQLSNASTLPTASWPSSPASCGRRSFPVRSRRPRPRQSGPVAVGSGVGAEVGVGWVAGEFVDTL